MLGLLRRRWWIGTGIKISGHSDECEATGSEMVRKRGRVGVGGSKVVI